MIQTNLTDRYLDEKGQLGESFVKWISEVKNHSYKKATSEENLYKGIDCFINGESVDVKNSRNLIFAKYKLCEDKFMIRHPFKKASEVKNICVLDLNTTSNIYKVVYYGILNNYLNNFFIDNKALEEFKNILNKYEFKNYKELNFNEVYDFYSNLKETLSVFLKPKAHIIFSDKEVIKKLKANDVTLSLFKSEKLR